MPGYFPPADVLDSLWFDGSAVYEIDIISAINRCLDKGFAASDVVVDAIITSQAHMSAVDATNYTSIPMLFRYLEISHYYKAMDGILRA